MKKYRLMKEYPLSGTIKVNDIVVKLTESFYSTKGKDNFVPVSHVENYPEYWEEVVEKDYEILKLKDENGYTYSLFTGELCSNNFNQKDSIYSVKRLSDGEVFTVGDKVRISRLQHDGYFVIDKFYFDCNGDKLLCNGKGSGNGHVSINKIKHNKRPLFTTEDGVDKYKGDGVYILDLPSFEISSKPDGWLNSWIPRDWNRAFSTREAAEAYVLMNKPCLSLNNVLNSMDEEDEDWFNTAIRRLRVLAKHKVKK